jgi:HPt (histidine-containing phosphotransfer) domain-containing protein
LLPQDFVQLDAIGQKVAQRTRELEAAQRKLATATEGPPAGTPTERAAAPQETTDLVCDRAELVRRVGGNPDVVREIIGLVQVECPRLLKAVRAALDGGSASEVERAAHSLKGTVGSIGARESLAVAQRLETLGRQGDLVQAGQAFPQLEEVIQRLQSVLATWTQESIP